MSHGYSPGIQTIWNGAVGDIQLIVKDPILMEDIQIYTSYKNQKITVEGNLISNLEHSLSGKIDFIIFDKNNNQVLTGKEDFTLTAGSNTFKTAINLMNRLEPWDEFTPNLYKLQVRSEFGETTGKVNIEFGVRDIEAKEGRFVINGKKTFMRGENDAGSFPLTGYPSMEKEDWLRVFTIGKQHGLNHWRFHSWCPPKAAFEAADQLGIYLQPELTLFSQDWEKTLVGTDPTRDEFLFAELKSLLDTYGNHPSFVLMCMGNELRGDPVVLEEWVKWGKDHDARHLYAGSANLEAMGKYIRLKGDDFQVAHAWKYNGKREERRMFPYFNSEIPNTENDYSHTLQAPFSEWPIIAHETGQWTVFPDFSEIKKYTGVLAPRNMEVFKSRLEQKGMLNQAHDFLMATGKLSAILYREEMERALRTPDLGGFQLLGLRDYQAQGSALIGMLNSLCESKGFISADEFKESCNKITLLLKMPKRVWLNNEEFKAELVIPNYGSSDLQNISIDWGIEVSGKEVLRGNIGSKNVKQGDVNWAGVVAFPLKGFKQATKLTITLSAAKLNIKNKYEIWVYPEKLPENTEEDILVATIATPELLQKIIDGKKVLLIPEGNYDAERTQFTTPFWSTILFDYQVKTMGVLCNPEHPIFENFPTDYHSNWQWWELTNNSYAAKLNQTDLGYKPIVQVIDHPVRNDKLGAIMETRIGKGKLLIVTFDILSNIENRPVARQLKYSILKYMASDKFDPQDEKAIKEAFFSSNSSKILYNNINSTNENSEHPIDFAFDSDEKTYWQSLPSGKTNILIILDLKEERYITGCTLVREMENSPCKFNVFVTNDKEQRGEPVIEGDCKQNNTFDAISWDNGFTIQKGKKGKYIFIDIETSSNALFRVNEFKWIFGD
ncbi:beta-galactosidase [Draconibacterium sp.]